MARPPLYYTFGNHMHWVDMQWLWGYDVLPGSVEDMLRLIDATGARGNVNFDAVGYEKMAVESPEHLALLLAAVMDGRVEPVGCTYGQPYGLFHGLESNIRQFTYGVRATRRMLGIRPRAFWEEEFCFFPQLPQVLVQCGYTGACLFFQWTWHTPELPREHETLIWWEGSDSTRVLALPRGELNVHQWPEDFDGVMDRALGKERGTGVQALGTGGKATAATASPAAVLISPSAECPVPSASSAALPPAIIQWLELMPSKDWMCRSEVLLPRLRELMNDSRVDIRPRTISGLIAELAMNVGAKAGGVESAREQGVDGDGIAVRRYRMDDVWHGMTLGKNADAHPRASAQTEAMIRSAEALAATVSLLGRPYPSWDVYPTWELDEAWRELLAAQHHDNHECEGLCGFVGHHQMLRAQQAAAEVLGRAERLLSRRTPVGISSPPFINPHGWPVQVGEHQIPAFGFRFDVEGPDVDHLDEQIQTRTGEREIALRCADLAVTVDRATGEITCLEDGVRRLDQRWLAVRMDDKNPQATTVEFSDPDIPGIFSAIDIRHVLGVQMLTVRLRLDAESARGVSILFDLRSEDGVTPIKPGPGLNKALAVSMPITGDMKLWCDVPGGIESVRAEGTFKRKYPMGDWMTSPQWFEEVARPFVARSLVHGAHEDGNDVLIVHDGSQQWLRERDRAWMVLTAYDPWDEKRYGVAGWTHALAWVCLPATSPTPAELARSAAERIENSTTSAMDAEPVGGGTPEAGEEAPMCFSPLEVRGAPGVLVQAFHRESMKSGEHLHAWAGHRMARESGGACTHPFVIRLMEWNNAPAEVELILAGDVAMAAKTNLLGEVFGDEPPREHAQGGWGLDDTGWLTPEPCDGPAWAQGTDTRLFGRPITWTRVRFTMRPREIATIYADMVMGRKQFRDLDAKRAVWATIHKVDADR